MISLKATQPNNYGTFSTESYRPSVPKPDPVSEPKPDSVSGPKSDSVSEPTPDSEGPPLPDYPYLDIIAKKHADGISEILKVTKVSLYSSHEGARAELNYKSEAPPGVRTFEDAVVVEFSSVRKALNESKYSHVITYI